MRLRLILSFILVVLVSIVSVALFARRGTVQEVQAFMYRGGMAGGEELVSILANYYQQNGSWQGVDALLDTPEMGNGMMGRGMMNRTMNQHLRIADANGRVVADTDSTSPSGKLTTTELDQALPIQTAQGQTIGYLLAENNQQPLLRRLNQVVLQAGLFAGGIALILALLLSYTLAKPVNQLTAAVKRMEKGDLSQRVPVSGGGELATLARGFNQMAGSLQRAEENRQAMTADIAHELRTPLSVQRAQLEALQDGVYPLTAENIQPLLDQNQVLVRLVEDLRTLALADAGELTLEKIPTDLTSLLETLMEQFRPVAEQRQIQMNLDTGRQGGYPKIVLDPGRVSQILGNVLNNALRYTPEGGQIWVSLDDQGREALIAIRDSGPGISAEALPHVFERFYRADRSRSRSDGGTGLGLAIARQLARAHGGDLTAENAPEGGAVFSLHLPIREQA